MSQQLISRSPDLKRLRDEGYDVEVRAGHLLVKDVPYVNARREVRRGTLVSVLDLAGDLTTRPSTHVAYFAGEQPCHMDGSEILQIQHQVQPTTLAPGLVVDRSFSNKPQDGYPDYYEKMFRYVTVLSGPAQALDPTATARTFPLVEPDEDDSSPFLYVDTASSRSGIGGVAAKLTLGRVAIIGLGGTGSYVLDLVAKTPVQEIHLYDGDRLSQHNAFRSPGAPSAEDLRAQPLKVDHMSRLYAAMRRGVVPHGHYVDGSNVHELSGMEMEFAFLCIDKGAVKAEIIAGLEAARIPFIDVGMGVSLDDGALGGVLRVTTSTEGQRDHVRAKHRIPLADGDPDDYAQNIQIADLNALNAALAVVRWKKLLGFYRDLEREHHSLYTIDGNHLVNDDQHGSG